MLELIRPTNYDFMGKRFIAYGLTTAIALIGVIALVIHHGPRLSIDFTGGTALEARFTPPVHVDRLRTALARSGFADSEIQEIGQKNSGDVLIRTSAMSGTALAQMRTGLQRELPNTRIEVLNQELVGPKIGSELKSKALWAIFWSLGLILLYVGVRYDFKFAVGGIVALFHDLFIVFGLCVLFNKEISLTVLAAFLTLAGYSINDTIVVFDRIREVMKGYRRDSMYNIMNISINQTLSRTVITALTVFLSVLALYLVGGRVIHDFAFAMLIGVISGTYSSIFVASALVLDWTRLTQKKAKAAPTAAVRPVKPRASKARAS
jgi:preprotein translocase SecF subunit